MRFTIRTLSIAILFLGSTCADLTHSNANSGSIHQMNTTTESEDRRISRRRRQHRMQRDIENVHTDAGVVSSSSSNSDSDNTNTDLDRLLKKVHAKQLGYHAIKVEEINVNEKGWRGDRQKPIVTKGKGKGEDSSTRTSKGKGKGGKGGKGSKSKKSSKHAYKEKCGKSRKSSKGKGKGAKSSKYNKTSAPTGSPTSLPSCSPAPSFSAEPSSYPSPTPTYEPTTVPSTVPTDVVFDLDKCHTYELDW